jgi:hypothetical protein
MLHFYFAPDLSWPLYVDKIKCQDNAVVAMNLKSAFSLIIEDIRRTDSLGSTTEVVLTLCIDEYQRIPVNPSCVRLQTIVEALSAVMTADHSHSGGIIVPVFAGLYLQPLLDAAQASAVKLRPVTLEPFDYDAASALARHFSGDESILGNPEARRIVFQLSAVPGYLVDVINYHEENSDWQESFKLVCLSRIGPTKLNSVAIDLIFSLIACSITKLPVPPQVCSAKLLDNCGFCWFRDRTEGTVCVPFSLIYIVSRGLVWKAGWIVPLAGAHMIHPSRSVWHYWAKIH